VHILLVADGRSPITRRWIEGLLKMDQRVSLVSTFPCARPQGVDAFHVLAVAFGGFSGSQVKDGSGKAARTSGVRRIVSRFRSLLQPLRNLIGPLTFPFYAGRFRSIVNRCKPDLVHALRIPYEGMLASSTPRGFPLVVSIWGNDLTLHAPASQRMGALTRRTMHHADGLIVDARRDLRLGHLWGFPEGRPTLVVPTCGGIDLDEMQLLRRQKSGALASRFPEDAPLVINPRGIRPGYVRNDTFFQAIPMLLQRQEKVLFACPSMAGQPEAVRWVERLKIGDHVHLLPYLTQEELWDLFTLAGVMVSITTHDGAPNTLLEAMALGCFPIAGDIESLREWITPGVNGMLVDPYRPQELAETLAIALSHPQLRQRAADINRDIIRDRAEAGWVRKQVHRFYEQVITGSRQVRVTPRG